MSETITLTTAQAIVRYLSAQFIEIDGTEHRLCGGGFGIFGHGNVTCLGHALEEVKDKLPAEKVSEVEGKVKSLREAIESNDTAAMATQSEALEAAMKEIAEVAYSSAAAEAGAPEGGAAPGDAEASGKGDDDVIDAEFEEGE